MSAPLVIVGTGLAGYNLAREWRKLDSSTPLLLISSDDGRAYSKPMLSTGFAKRKDADGLVMAQAEQMAAAAEKQSLVAEDIARQINSISQATNDNVEVTGQSARLGNRLESTAESLQALVERFNS